MSQSFALRLILSCCIVWNAVFGGLQKRSTTGGRDKRTGAQARYVPVVVGFLTYRKSGRSAISTSNLLISLTFGRATTHLRGLSA